MSVKVAKSDYAQIVEVYNNDGREAACMFMEETFGVKLTSRILSNIKKSNTYIYNQDEDRFEVRKDTDECDIFLSLEQLCGTTPAKSDYAGKEANDDTDKIAALEKLTKELISDRLLELSRYVILDPVSRKILVDSTMMATDGYQVVMH